MESAIPKGLICPRTQARRISDDFVPPYPAWTARSVRDDGVTTMAYLGVQFHDKNDRAGALALLNEIGALLANESGCSFRDFAHYQDEAGHQNFIAIAYWTDEQSYRSWHSSPAVTDWWDAKVASPGSFGFFREVLSPTSDRFETLFSASDQLEGVGKALGMRSEEEIQEHSYWGSMRDRLPCSQADLLEQSGALRESGRQTSGVVKISGHQNVALIRSGQDWTDTKGMERALYLDGIEPVFREGMDFLRDEGINIGCYVNRYMTCVNLDGTPIQKSFGMSYWRSLGDMEAWAEHHPTHLRIFGTFMETVQKLEFQLDLRLYHEVSVLRPDQQFYEYLNCHDRTGLVHAATR